MICFGYSYGSVYKKITPNIVILIDVRKLHCCSLFRHIEYDHKVEVQGSGHYWWLLKIIIITKPFLIMSNGERLIVWNIVRNGSFWSNVVFEKGVIFRKFYFETSDLEFEVSKSSIRKCTTLCDKGDFFFHYYLAVSTTVRAQIFTGLLFYAYVEIHQVRRLVFDKLPIVSTALALTCDMTIV